MERNLQNKFNFLGHNLVLVETSSAGNDPCDSGYLNVVLKHRCVKPSSVVYECETFLQKMG